MSEEALKERGFRPLYVKMSAPDDRGIDGIMVLEKLTGKRMKRKAATLYVSAHYKQTKGWDEPAPLV